MSGIAQKSGGLFWAGSTFVFLTIALSNVAAADVLPYTLLRPDVRIGAIAINYNATTDLFEATGTPAMITLQSGSTIFATLPGTDAFRLQAKIDASGHASTASLFVQVNGETWFQSGSLTSAGDPALPTNANFLDFGSGSARVFTFLFKQDAVALAGQAPGAGSTFEIKINGQNASSPTPGDIADTPTYNADFTSGGFTSTADVAPVPLPQVVPGVAVLLALIVAWKYLGRFWFVKSA